MSEDKIVRNMRNMAWERAKGELRSMLHTFWDRESNYDELSTKVENFIHDIEENGLHE